MLLQNVEIPIVSYCKKGNFMEVDTHIHSEEAANCHLKAIKEFSPFNEYSVGQKLGLFDEMGTGTQIYIWNLAKWGSDHSLEWLAGKTSDHSSYQTQGDILVRSKRIRSRPGQISQKVGYSVTLLLLSIPFVCYQNVTDFLTEVLLWIFYFFSFFLLLAFP